MGSERLWQTFDQHIEQLNDTSPTGAAYKVLFLGRHGQGWHNVAESKYGTPEWDVSDHVNLTTQVLRI